MKYSLLIICMIICLSLFSQKDTTKVVVYAPFNASETIDPQKDLIYPVNQIKWNFGMLVRGVFEMDYERAITDKLTIEVGAGITYFDFIYTAFSEINDFDLNSGNELKYGPLLYTSLRFYPGDVLGFEGFYISTPFRYRKYNAVDKESYYQGVYQTTVNFNNNHEHYEGGFVVGYSSGNYYEIIWDYYLGVGISSVNATYMAYDNNSIPFQYSEHRSNPVFYFGLKMGFSFL